MEEMKQPLRDRLANAQDDRLLLARLLDGDADASGEFFHVVKDTVWTACRLATPDASAARQAYALVRERLRADGFARLRSFRGGRLTSFAAIAAREILIEHILDLPKGATDRRWLTFETLFKNRILAVIVRLYPDPGAGGSALTGAFELSAKQMDIYQRVSMALAKDDYRLLRSYVAEGKLGRSLRRIVINAAIDQHREEDGRRMLPAPIEKLSSLDKLVFRAVHWEREPQDARMLLSVLAARTQPGLTSAAIEASLLRVRAAIGPTYTPRTEISLSGGDDDDGDVELPAPQAEDESGEQHVLREGAIQALATAIEGMPDRERIFVRTLLEGSNTERRQLFGEDNYKLMRRVKTRLQRDLAGVPAIKNWLENMTN